jgi:hypothetical protein
LSRTRFAPVAALVLVVLVAGCGSGGRDYAAAATVACVRALPEHSGAHGIRVSPTAPSLTVLRLDGRPIQAQRVTLSFIRPNFGSASGTEEANLYFLPDRSTASSFRDRWERALPSSLARRAVQLRGNAVVVWGRAPSDRALHLALGCLRGG